MKIYLGGVNASGKSTLANRIGEISGLKVVHATGLLMKELGCTDDYQALRKFTQQERDVALEAVMESLLETKDSFIVDGHYLSLVEGRVERITGPWLQKFDAIGLISASTETLIKRIGIDERVRDRALFTRESSLEERRHVLQEYIMKTCTEFNRVKTMYKLPAIHILNEDLENSVQVLEEWLSSVEGPNANTQELSLPSSFS